jgi:glycosyltransferase involved in cell wall biosynthesis
MKEYFPKISIITSTFNSANTLSDTIDSILRQTYQNIEYIIIDGSSTDGTLGIIKSYSDAFEEKNFSFKWKSELDTGIYNAWTKALKMVTGEWIMFLGSDDYLKNDNIIEECLPHLEIAIEQNCRFVYGKIEHVDSQKQLIEISGKPWEEQKKRFTYTMNIGHSGSFNHKSLFEDYGKFNESFSIVGDYEFLLREFKNKNKNAFFLNKTTLVMREGGVSSSLNNRLVVVKENQKARKLNGITTFSKELFFWEIRIRTIMIFSRLFGENFAAKLADLYRNIKGKEKRWSV